MRKDPRSQKDEWDPSAISNYGDLPDWQPHYLVWFLSHDKLFYWIKWANCHLQSCVLFFYSSHTTYTKMCRLLLIHKMVVPSHHIRHIYDATTFQTIVMSQVALWHHHVHCLLLLLSWHHCWRHYNNKMLMATDGRSLHCGDLHRKYLMVPYPSST